MYLKKDFRLMKAEFWFALAAVVFLEVLGIVLVVDNRIIVKTQVHLSLGILGLFMPVYIALALLKERKNAASLWFTFPASGYRFIAAKIVAGLLSMLALTVVTVIFSVGIMMFFDASIALLSHKLIWCLILLELGIGMGLMVVFISGLLGSVNHYLPKNRGFLSFLMFCGLLIGLIYFVTTDLYALFSWGSFSMSGLLDIPESRVPEDFNERYIGEYVFDWITNIGLFLISGWLFDKKVEV